MLPGQPQSEFRGQFRWGRVNVVKAKEHRVEVKFDENGGFISRDMPVVVTHPKDYALPPKDTMVLCVLVDGAEGHGFVIGCFYTDEDAPPLDDDGKRSIAGDDLRLGDPDADQKVALADLVKDRLDKLQDKFDNHTHQVPGSGLIDGMSAPITGTATAQAPASKVGALEDVAAENVSAK